MKRVAELENEAKRIQKEISAIKNKESFVPLLDADLAEWKAKLREKASDSLDLPFKLVVYSEWDDSPLQYARNDYRPDIFGDKPWSVEEWQGNRHTGNGIIVATANTAKDLMPDPIALKRLSLFRLPYIVCPTEWEHPKILKAVFNTRWESIGFGLIMFYQIYYPQSNLYPIAGIQQPDLTNSDHVEKIYHFREAQNSEDVRRAIDHLKFLRDQRFAQNNIEIEGYESAMEWRAELTH
jgi:hypothetical protein